MSDVSIGMNTVVLHRMGSVYYSWRTSAAFIWMNAGEIPDVAIWHTLTQPDMMHRTVVQREDLQRVADLANDHGKMVVITW